MQKLAKTYQDTRYSEVEIQDRFVYRIHWYMFISLRLICLELVEKVGNR